MTQTTVLISWRVHVNRTHSYVDCARARSDTSAASVYRRTTEASRCCTVTSCTLVEYVVVSLQ